MYYTDYGGTISGISIILSFSFNGCHDEFGSWTIEVWEWSRDMSLGVVMDIDVFIFIYELG